MRAQSQEPMFRPGSRFHLFVIVRLLGRGGMAEVYEVKYQGRRYALKVLQRRLQLSPSQLRRFESEGRFLLRVRHANLVDVQDMGVNEGVFWIRMELLHGMELREAIHRLGPMSVGLVGVWLRQAAYGAHQCHSLGVVHRDIKPENVMLLRPDGVKLLDLGVAKIDGEIVTIEGGPDEGLRGTALYMSPEQVKNEKHITAAADVYALGMTGWEMLKGESPFLRDGQRFELIPTLYKQVHEEVQPLHELGFDRRLSRVFERALSKTASKRQPDGLTFAEELGDAVDRYLAEHPDDDPNPGEPVLAWLFGESSEVPSFGTGPMTAGRASGVGPRPSAPIPVGPLGSANPLPATARPIPRFQTMPMAQVPAGWTPPLLDESNVEPDQRVTNVMPTPLALRRFDTVSLPPELRDPSALRALAGHRPEGKKARHPSAALELRREPLATPATLVSLPGVTLPETEALTERRPRARRRTASASLALAALFVGAWIVVWRVAFFHYGRPAVEPVLAQVAPDAGAVNVEPADAGFDAETGEDAGIVVLEAADSGPDAADARDAGLPIAVKPALPPAPKRAILRPKKPAKDPRENLF